MILQEMLHISDLLSAYLSLMKFFVYLHCDFAICFYDYPTQPTLATHRVGWPVLLPLPYIYRHNGSGSDPNITYL